MKILITESEDLSEVALAKLRNLGEVHCAQLDYTGLESCIENFDALVLRLGIKLDRNLLSKAVRLRYILTPTTGLDHIDQEFAAEKEINIYSLKGEQVFLNSIPSTAEHSFALLLALLRNLPFAAEHARNGAWNRQLFRGHNLRGMDLGILGMGRVGFQVAGYARAFGMNVLTYDPASNYSEPWMTQLPTAEALLASSRILSIHIPMDEANRGYLSAERLAHLPNGAFIINTSRGGVWDEEAIADMMNKGKLMGVATDVLADEQDEVKRGNSPLVRLAKAGKNIIITPHVAGATYESMHMTEEFVVEKWIRLMNVNNQE